MEKYITVIIPNQDKFGRYLTWWDDTHISVCISLMEEDNPDYEFQQIVSSPGNGGRLAFAIMKLKANILLMKPKYLVRPNDFSIFDLDESNGCYRCWSKNPTTYADGTRPNAMTHFTLENLTKNYNFFAIDESQIESYEQKCKDHYKFLSWQSRSDGHGGSKGGTMEEYQLKMSRLMSEKLEKNENT